MATRRYSALDDEDFDYPSRTRAFAGSLGPGSYEVSNMKRARGGSISGRLRSASNLEERGVIDQTQKGVLKDLIIAGDRELQVALDAYERGEPALLEGLMQRGMLNRRDSLDLLQDIDFAFLSVDPHDDIQDDNGSDRDSARGQPEEHEPLDTGGHASHHRAGGTSGNSGGSSRWSDSGKDDFVQSRPMVGNSARRYSAAIEPAGAGAAVETFDLEEMTFDAAFEDEYSIDHDTQAATIPGGGADGCSGVIGEDMGEGGGGGGNGAGAAMAAAANGAAAQRWLGLSLGPLGGMASSDPGAVTASHALTDALDQKDNKNHGAALLRKVKTETVLAEVGPLPAQREHLEDLAVMQMEDAAGVGGLIGELGMLGSPLGGPTNLLGGLDFSPHFRFSFTGENLIDLAGVGRVSLKEELQLNGMETLSEPAPARRTNAASPRASLAASAAAAAAAASNYSAATAAAHSSAARNRGGGSGATAAVRAHRIDTSANVRLVLPTASALARAGEKGRVGAYSPESRRRRLERFLEKRQHRVWVKTVKYDVRKSFADTRMRVKGRFVKKDDESLLRELMALT